MYTHDVIQIVDAYPRNIEKHAQTMRVDPDGEALSLSTLIRPLGRNARKIAIVAKDDYKRLHAYQQAGYENHPMNGDRPKELIKFIRRMISEIKQSPPKHMVLVSDDPEFIHLCDEAAEITDLSVWASEATVPRELAQSAYGYQPLEELLPNLKIARIDVRLDMENIFIGLVQRGWRPNLRELIEAIHVAMDDIGRVITVTGYADFDELNRHHGGPRVNWQRELTLAGGESRYVVNQHGKNTADMKIADDIRTLVEFNPGSGDMIDIICLATMDRDFRHTVETAQSRGKKVVVLALKGGLSRELESVAGKGNVRYLDDYLKLPQAKTAGAAGTSPAQTEDVTLMLRIAAKMHNNRWHRVYRDWLNEEFSAEMESVKTLIAAGWLSPIQGGPTDAQGQPRALEPNPDHPTAAAAHYLARWIPTRVDYCLNKRGMQYVDTNYLAGGMSRERMLTGWGIGQTRRAAENWLQAAANAGLVVAEEITHPESPSKVITAWRLPEMSAPTLAATVTVAEVAAAEAVEPREVSPPTKDELRRLLTQELSDDELTRLLSDHFRAVHVAVEGTPKFTRIQAVLSYVESCGLHNKLLAAIHAVKPALTEAAPALPLAA